MIRKVIKKQIIWAVFIFLIITTIVLCVVVFSHPTKYSKLILKYSKMYGIEANLVGALINVESTYNPKAVSPVGAVGLMQIMPTTASEISKKLGDDYSSINLFDEDTNIRYGCYYLSYLYLVYGDTTCVLAAYNAGLGNVNSWLKNSEYSADGKHLKYIPFKETREYVYKIIKDRAIYKIYYTM